MSRYVIAIIGRPNVGKSTLFNRIIGARGAIVHDLPGVTRDRNYAECVWNRKSFTLIDTGGYLPQSSSVLEKAIREQASAAIDEANAIIFLVDANEGVTPLDLDIASVLRRSNKKLYLVVNKVDTERHEVEATNFFRLGLGDPVSLSAAHGRKVGDFLDLITKDISLNSRHSDDPRFKLAIIGKPNVGKSSLANALAGEQRSIVAEAPGTTRDAIDTVIRYYGEEILLVDTAGLRRRSRIKESVEFFSTLRTIKSIERCDVAVILVDALQGMDKQDLRIVESVAGRKRPMLLAVNKWDLIEKDTGTAKQFERSMRSMLRMYDYIPIIFISAKTKQRIDKVIQASRDVFAEYLKRIPTNKVNNTLLSEIKRKPPSSSSGKEIKIKYVTQVRSRPPAFSFFTNEPKLVQDSYRRFLEGKIREHFGFTGVPLTLYFRRKSR